MVRIPLDTNTINTPVRRRLQFQTPIDEGSLLPSGNMADNDTPMGEALTQGGDNNVGGIEHIREKVESVPEEMLPSEAVQWLHTKDYSDLDNKDLGGLLWHAAGFTPRPDDAAAFKTWWYDIAHGLGRVRDMDPELQTTYQEALAAIERNCAPSTGITIRPPSGLYPPTPNTSTQGVVRDPVDQPMGTRVTVPVDDEASYPACFANYWPDDPLQMDKLKTRWHAAVQAAIKGSKPEKTHTIKHPLQYVDGLLSHARMMLDVAQISSAFRAALDPTEQMPATLAMLNMDPALLVRLEKASGKITTAATLKEAVDLELTAQREITDYLADVTKTRSVTGFTAGGDFAKFLKSFDEAWASLAVKMVFPTPEKEEDRRIISFLYALPFPLLNKVFAASHKAYNDFAPPTWNLD